MKSKILIIGILSFLFSSVLSSTRPVSADPLPSVFGEYIPGAVTGSNPPYSFGQGWGAGVDWNAFLNETIFVRGGVQFVNFVGPGLFLMPITVGAGFRFTKGTPGDLYGVFDVGGTPGFYPGGSSFQSYYDLGVGYSFTRVYVEFKAAIIPGTNYANGTLLYFPLLLGIHL